MDSLEQARVSVNADDLREILSALNGPAYLIRELQAIRSLGNSSIDRLIKEYNDWAEGVGGSTDE